MLLSFTYKKTKPHQQTKIVPDNQTNHNQETHHNQQKFGLFETHVPYTTIWSRIANLPVSMSISRKLYDEFQFSEFVQQIYVQHTQIPMFFHSIQEN